MRSLTRDQFLKIFGLTSGAFDAQQRAGHVALAFGTPMPATPGRYFDLDLVAMAIAPGSRRRWVGKPPQRSCWGSLTSGSRPSVTPMRTRRSDYFFAMGLVVGIMMKDVLAKFG